VDGNYLSSCQGADRCLISQDNRQITNTCFITQAFSEVFGLFALPFHSQMCQTFFLIYSESSRLDGSKHTSFCSTCLSWVEQYLFKAARNGKTSFCARHFFWHVQNPHDQTVLTILVHTYPELSNICLKHQETVQEVSDGFWWEELFANRFCILTTIARPTKGIES
jgi:hypothetical protein